MMRPNLRLSIAIGMAGATLLVSAGCESKLKSPAASPHVEVDRENEMTMTPAEKNRRFREVYMQGVELAGREQYGLALASFEEASRIDPENPDALFNLGACHEAIGDPLAAINIYKDVLKIMPDDADCYTNLGTSFMKMYYREKSPTWKRMAQEAWEHSLAINPHQPQVREYLESCRSAQ